MSGSAFSLPPALGTIRLEDEGSSAGRVILIENAHGHYPAQAAIRHLLQYLQKTEPISLIALEGASGPLDMATLRFFPSKKINREIAQDLASRGMLTGAEWFALTEKNSPRLEGVENAKLYRKNFKALQTVIRGRRRAQNILSRAQQALTLEQRRVFHPALFSFYSQAGAFEKNQLPFEAWAGELKRQAKKVLGLELESPALANQFPHLSRYLSLQEIRFQVHPARLKREIKTLLGLINSGVPDSLQRNYIVSGLLSLPTSPQSFACKRVRDFFERLYQITALLAIDFRQFPELRRLAAKMILSDEINPEALFEEAARAAHQILNGLARSSEERKLLRKSRDFLLLKRLLRLELRADEWKEIKQSWVVSR
ncbi:MAG: hypothetical protein HY586_00580, partial [Candidatus Omnitrophica bacterium]|nr:hypothetical protein [Candidatus Omnitrophota bacterium]